MHSSARRSAAARLKSGTWRTPVTQNKVGKSEETGKAAQHRRAQIDSSRPPVGVLQAGTWNASTMCAAESGRHTQCIGLRRKWKDCVRLACARALGGFRPTRLQQPRLQPSRTSASENRQSTTHRTSQPCQTPPKACWPC